MEQSAIERLRATARVISGALKRFRTLPTEDAEIVQLFFDAELTVEQISQVYEQPEDRISEAIVAFVTQFLADNPQIQQRLSSAAALGTAPSATARRWAESLFAGFRTGRSEETVIRDLIGEIIRISIPPEPDDLCARIIATGTTQRLRLPVKLDERDFFLGTRRRAAGQGAEEQEADHAVRIASKGSVSLTRGSEQIDVGFTIVREEGEAATYAIVFENLPNWAVPVEFGFTGSDSSGAPKDYSFEGTFEGSEFLFDVGNDPDQEMAFIERTNTYITCDSR
jgi:hypothetical protein